MTKLFLGVILNIVYNYFGLQIIIMSIKFNAYFNNIASKIILKASFYICLSFNKFQFKEFRLVK